MQEQESLQVYIRHGQSEANTTPHIINGRGNHHPLTPKGEAQAALVGPWLLDYYGMPDAIYVSPALRTLETARIAMEAAGIDMPISIEDDIQELDQGEWTGLLRETQHTEAVKAQMIVEGIHFKAPGGESIAEAAARMKRASQAMQLGKVWVFGHGGAIRFRTGDIEGWSLQQMLEANTHMSNTSVTEIARSPKGFRLNRFGMVAHLPFELRSN